MKFLFAFLLFTVCIHPTASQTSTSLFGYTKKEADSASIVLSRQIDSATVFEKVVLEGFDSKVPFFHFINTRNNAKNYIVLLHGLGDSKNAWVYPSESYLGWSKNLTAIKDSLISLGYSLLIPDAKYHGERSYELNFRPAEALPPLLSKNEKDSQYFEVLMSSTVKDVRIILDYVQHRFKIPDLKFGVVGYSMGGALAILLNATDHRISSIVACVPPLNHPEKELEGFKWSEQIKNGLASVTPYHYADFQKAPILLLMGKNDFFYTEEEVTTFIKNIPTTKKELKYFDSGHILPDEYKTDVLRWITMHNTVYH
jgi:dienelactone hydrolase